MKKILISALFAALFGSAYAQSNVTIYGQLDVSVQGQNINGGSHPNSPNGSLTKIASNSSWLGFRGTEDLGNGSSALFQVETQVNMNGTGTGNMAYGGAQGFTVLRDTYVGLNNQSAGLVKLGYLSTPYKNTLDQIDVFDGRGDAQIATIFGRTVAGAGSTATAVSQYAMNQTAYGRSTSVMYVTPELAGFTGSLLYSGNGSNNNTTDQINTAAVTGAVAPNSVTSGNLKWSGSGVNVIGSVQHARYTNAAGINVSSLASSNNYVIGAYYVGIPGLKVGAAYGRNQENLNAIPSSGATTANSNSTWVGASYRFGNNEPRISYVNTSNTSGSGNNYTFGSQNGASQWNLGWGYYLSKRTQVYAIASQIKNNANGVYNFASYTGGTTNNLTGGETLTTYGVGMKTAF